MITQVNLGEYVPKSGVYYDKARNAPCHVCAIGAAWASLVRVRDKKDPPLGWGPDSSDMVIELGDAMNGYTRIMENAFEGFGRDDNGIDWLYKFPDDAKRMKAIMRNIIRNGGRFRISEVP